MHKCAVKGFFFSATDAGCGGLWFMSNGSYSVTATDKVSFESMYPKRGGDVQPAHTATDMIGDHKTAHIMYGLARDPRPSCASGCDKAVNPLRVLFLTGGRSRRAGEFIFYASVLRH